MDVPSYLLGKKASGGGSYTETDPIFSVSPASGITSNDITNWNGKQNTLVSGTNIKTINNESILGSGNIEIQGGGATYTAGTNIEITEENVINNTIAYERNSRGFLLGTKRTSTGLGTSAIAIGSNNVSVGQDSIVIGNSSNSTMADSIAIGRNANSHGQRGIAIGAASKAEVENAITIGGGDDYSGYRKAIAIGYNANPTANNTCMFGSSDFNINKIEITTSTGTKIMATQEFVQNYLTTLSGYDSTKTQILKNINGTMTWVDEV